MINQCYDCAYAGSDRPAVQQLCGRWLCRYHLEYWLEKGASVLRAVQIAIKGPP